MTNCQFCVPQRCIPFVIDLTQKYIHQGFDPCLCNMHDPFQMFFQKCPEHPLSHGWHKGVCIHITFVRSKLSRGTFVWLIQCHGWKKILYMTSLYRNHLLCTILFRCFILPGVKKKQYQCCWWVCTALGLLKKK